LLQSKLFQHVADSSKHLKSLTCFSLGRLTGARHGGYSWVEGMGKRMVACGCSQTSAGATVVGLDVQVQVHLSSGWWLILARLLIEIWPLGRVATLCLVAPEHVS
jgi:hypothetical protein